MIIQPSNFDSARKITISPRRLEEGYFIEFNTRREMEVLNNTIVLSLMYIHLVVMFGHLS
tara:strand:+ start:452 stop:631 length:180 start_codon:yes stop_codon:yes gene_type:complete